MHENAVHEDIYEALADAIMAIGGFKKAAYQLWPALKHETAYARLKNALREDRDEKLSPEEVLVIGRMARYAGCHSIAAYYCGAMGYETPDTKEPEDERAALQRQFLESLEMQKKIVSRMESLTSSVTEMRVHPRRGAA